MVDSRSDTPSARFTPRGTLGWFFKAVLAGVVALVLWELLLSQLILQKPTSQTHPVLGRIYGQGLYVQGKEGYGRATLNELGLRSPDMATLETATGVRVLVLGDSYTQAMQVSNEVAFPQQLNTLLGEDSIVINAGREGGSPADYIALENFNKTTFQPDVVVVQLNEGDFTRDLLSKNQTFYLESAGNSYTMKENKAVVSSNELATRFAALQGILNFSIFRVALERVEAMRANTGGHGEDPKPAEEEKPESDGSLERFVVEGLKEAYGTPMLLYIPEMDYFQADYAEARSTEKHLAEAAKEASVTFISMLPDYARLYKETHKIAHGFANTKPGIGHINDLGHTLIAERLAETIKGQVRAAQ
ncbi:MAG: SGNH/GDSL hydrolase family protein [Trueperaceae bacterium]